MEIIRTDSSNVDFQVLVKLLDAYLSIKDGDDHEFYDQFNKITNIGHVVVVYCDGLPVGCGAFKEFTPDKVEIKRMFVQPDHRGQGIAGIILTELEKWAFGVGYKSCILETGKKQYEAIRLYEKSGYKRISNYGQYKDVENSICMEKLQP